MWGEVGEGLLTMGLPRLVLIFGNIFVQRQLFESISEVEKPTNIQGRNIL